jgi:uncharacterized membrane protein YidH (DUF202 family)
LRPSVAAFGIYIDRHKENHIKTEGEHRVEDNLFQTAYFWLAPTLIILSIAVALNARRRARIRHQPLHGRMGRTTLSRFAQPLPGDLDLIAQIGENSKPQQTAGTQVLRTTLGLRAISLGISALGLSYLASGRYAPQGFAPDNTAMVLIFVTVLAIGVLDVLTYELQYDRHGMVLTRFMYWRRSYEWAHLMGIDDDQHYQYVLAFSKGGRVKVMKHLVGMPEFLTLVGKTLDRNEDFHAGTARG